MPYWPRVFGDNPAREWDALGKRDPYYGVLSAPEYRSVNLSDERLHTFFASGTKHVERVLAIAAKHFGAIKYERCLDFGSGVGRLVVPFSKQFKSVTGVDISPSMIAVAQKNCVARDISNVTFANSLDDVQGQYDLVHSYIVLQHIPVRAGYKAIEQLISKTAPQGICFLHFTVGRKMGLRRLGTLLRKNVKPLHFALNLLAGRQLTDPYMQINEYNLSRIVTQLYDKGISDIWLETENHDGPYSTCLVFRVPA